MVKEKIKSDGTNAEFTAFGCCNPDNFKRMFEEMSKCFPGQGDATDFFAMKNGMMKNMMAMCCGPKTTDSKEDTELQKEQEKETESTEEE